jgi:RNA polymerase sigma factor (TIGR02999 family)
MNVVDFICSLLHSRQRNARAKLIANFFAGAGGARGGGRNAKMPAQEEMDASTIQVSGLLRQWSGGDAEALDRLVPIVYKELRRLAHYHLRRERTGCTLQTTALVHEVYLRFCSQQDARWQDRAHFFAVAARMMRRILVDNARRRGAEKRGADGVRVPLEDALGVPMQRPSDLIALDDALAQLAVFDSRKCQVVEMRFFAGLRAKEIAVVLKTTEATVRRDWVIAKAWLFRRLDSQVSP